MDIGASEAQTFGTGFLRKLKRRGLSGVKLVISDAHEGIKAAVAKVFRATWQRCRVGPLKKSDQAADRRSGILAVIAIIRQNRPVNLTIGRQEAATAVASRFRLIAAAAM
jgi:putative transposase